MKIIIVEDELKTLQGIERLIQEIGGNYEIVGKARNGQEGVSLALANRPDVILTDIKMTQMSGIDMMKALREADFSCKYIIISGYADFDYAREALVLGSVDYLLKPMTREMLENALKKAERLLEEETESIRPANLSAEELLEKILSAPQEAESKYAQAFYQKYKDREHFILLLIKGDNRLVAQELDKIRQKLEKRLKRMGYICCTDAEHREVYVLLEASGHNAFEALDLCMQECRAQISEYLAFAGKEFTGIKELPAARNKLMDMIQWNLTVQQPSVLREDILGKTVTKKFTYPVERERKIVKMIHTGEMECLETEIDGFLECLQNDIYDYADIREAMVYLTMAMLYAVRSASYGLYENINSLNILGWVQNLLFVSHYRQIIVNVLRQYEHYTKNLKKSEHPTINRVLKIIDAQYREELTLEAIAERMNITPEYLSSLFMKELGIKFTTYYTQRKIEAAKQLLADKNKKIYEVAQACGYNDVGYFCKVFKKYTGTSPGEYSRTLE